jgi:amino-acid N-acetyltransferase
MHAAVPKRSKTDSHVRWFREAAPYIHTHRGRTFVLAVPGEAVADAQLPHLINDIALLHSMGVRLVLVHGARPQIEGRLRAAGLALRYHQGLRVTDAEALAVVKEAVGSVRVELEAGLSTSLINTPMSGARVRVSSGNFVTARPLGVREGVDFDHTGEVRRVDAEAIQQQLALGNIVLLSPLGYSPTGEAFNLSGEDVASATAISLRADKLVFLTEGAERRLPLHIPLVEAQRILARRRLDPITALHLRSAIDACLSGVRRVHLVNRGIDGALLLELYTRDGVGRMVASDDYEGLRQARPDDIGGILELIAPLEEAGALMRRSREQLELEIGRFSVIERDGMLIACAAVYPYASDAMGELACLAVHPDYRDQGRGEALLAHVEQQAQALGLERLFVLTTHTPHWFRERGFAAGTISELPMRKRALYNYQRRSKVFFKELAARRRR